MSSIMTDVVNTADFGHSFFCQMPIYVKTNVLQRPQPGAKMNLEYMTMPSRPKKIGKVGGFRCSYLTNKNLFAPKRSYFAGQKSIHPMNL